MVLLQYLIYGIRGVFLLMMMSVLISCGGNQSSSTQAVESSNEDQIILDRLNQDIRTPEGFYQEEQPDDAFYSISHIKNTMLSSTASYSYDLCSYDNQQAYDWAVTASSRQASKAVIIPTQETMLYFEFMRKDTENNNVRYLDRVFKCSFIDRSPVLDNRLQGVINLRPVDADDASTLVEYLWTFSYANNWGNTVLSSTTSDAGNNWQQILREARWQPANGQPCGQIDIVETRYQVNKISGEILREESPLRNIAASWGIQGFQPCN